ncbi:MAG: hypothetical protein CL578_05955 [Alteromonadaceae bacterium]|nr:hypothetical protein [Paraglaciecola agarilytica]MBN24576.1 hypothetical protein [Alteromonadaceae bacterium]|tara:strand:- start:83631 stop:84206 length:576 start_codon:yes stop_codon:yes gene_type:complete
MLSIFRKIFREREAIPEALELQTMPETFKHFFEIDCINNVVAFTSERPKNDLFMIPGWATRTKKFKDDKIIKNVITGSAGLLCYNLMLFENDIVDDDFINILERIEAKYSNSNNPWVPTLLECARLGMSFNLYIESMEQEERIALQIARNDYYQGIKQDKQALNNWLFQRYLRLVDWVGGQNQAGQKLANC